MLSTSVGPGVASTARPGVASTAGPGVASTARPGVASGWSRGASAASGESGFPIGGERLEVPELALLVDAVVRLPVAAAG